MSGVNKAILKDLYEVRKLSIPQIATQLRLPLSTIRCRMIKAGIILRSRTDGVRLRGPHISQMQRGKKRIFSPVWIRNIRLARLRHADLHAVGVSLKSDGYLEFTRGPHKGRPVHDVIVEQRIGRRLMPNEIVHHDNEVRHDNSDKNLILMTRADHTALHRRREAAKRKSIGGDIGRCE